MYVDYLPLGVIQILLCDADQLVEINVVVPEPELWRQRERANRRGVLPPKTFNELIVTRLTLSNVSPDAQKLRLWQCLGAESYDIGLCYVRNQFRFLWIFRSRY